MKVCFKCGVEKPLFEYYKHSKMADGHLNKCKSCTKKDVKAHREDNLEKVQEYDRNRPNRLERNSKNIERTKTKYHNEPEYREKILETKKKWEHKNPQKREAQNYLANAVRDGRKIKLPYCEHCDTTEGKIHGHHWSYDPKFWLDVIWLCPSCHGAEHRRLNKVGRNPDRPIN